MANKTAYKDKKKQATKTVAAAKAQAYDQLYEDMDSTEGQGKVLRIGKQRDKNSKDIYQTKLIKDETGTVLIEDDKIVDRWRGIFRNS